MAKHSNRSSTRARVSAAGSRTGRPGSARAAPRGEQVRSWWADHGVLIGGSLLAFVGIALACWVSLGSMPLVAARATVLEFFGGGVYLLAATLAWLGTVLMRWGVGQSAGRGLELRRVAGIALIAIGAWGVVGAIEPATTLGGIRLDEFGAGGQLGSMLDSAFGWIMIAGGLVAALVLIAPGLARDGLDELREAGRIAGGDLRRRGPGAVAASGRATWQGVTMVAGALETGTARGARSLGRSVGRLADGRRDGERGVSGSSVSLGAGSRAMGGSGGVDFANIGHAAPATVAVASSSRGELLSRSTALAPPAPLHSELRAGFGGNAAGEETWPLTARPGGLRPAGGLAPDIAVAKARARAAAAAAPSPLAPQNAAQAPTVDAEAPIVGLVDEPAEVDTGTARDGAATTGATLATGTRGARRKSHRQTIADVEPPKRRPARNAEDGWRLPPLELLDPDPTASLRSGAEDQARIIVQTLASFGVDATVTQINEGPTITQFGVEPGWEVKTRQTTVKDAQGQVMRDEAGRALMREEEISRTRVRVNRITRLADDLALALAAPSIRIEAPVPGQPIVGVEVPNADTRLVSLRGLVEAPEFAGTVDRGGLAIALGRDVTGGPVIADLTKMPHVLIAGATGSGKSVCINTIISSLLMNKSPEEVRLILVDPKRVELTGYGSVPHLAFSHVVTEPDEVVSVLGVVVAEMDRRYRTLEQSGARNIAAYNGLPSTSRKMPYWVVVLDELADMMMAAPADVERQLVRLAQLARAVGIHLVVATQRPSVDVVTGLIKANFPTRIAFATTSQTDARVIMDRAGAEKLMGRGDMLYMSSDTIKPRRVQGSYVSDEEIERLIEWWTSPGQAQAERQSLDEMLDELGDSSEEAVTTIAQRNAQADLDALHQRLETALSEDEAVERTDDGEEPDIVLEVEPVGDVAVPGDTRIAEAKELAREYERVSATLLQRRMRIGRPRAERLIEELERAGVVAASDGGQSRRVLAQGETGG